MTRNEELKALFANDFKVGSDGLLSCPLSKVHGVNLTREAAWTPYMGSEESEVMVVAETPSTSGRANGRGSHVAGFSQDVPENDRPLRMFLEYVHHRFGAWPHFTDVVKCGLGNTSESKTIIKSRTDGCVERFLLEEIKLVKPKRFFAWGGRPTIWFRYAKSGTRSMPLLKCSSFIISCITRARLICRSPWRTSGSLSGLFR